MSYCSGCCGLILEPNKMYGYAGPICHCLERPQYREREPVKVMGQNIFQLERGEEVANRELRRQIDGLCAERDRLREERRDLLKTAQSHARCIDLTQKERDRYKAALEKIVELRLAIIEHGGWEMRGISVTHDEDIEKILADVLGFKWEDKP